jgi:hypothetical protein
MGMLAKPCETRAFIDVGLEAGTLNINTYWLNRQESAAVLLYNGHTLRQIVVTSLLDAVAEAEENSTHFAVTVRMSLLGRRGIQSVALSKFVDTQDPVAGIKG